MLRQLVCVTENDSRQESPPDVDSAVLYVECRYKQQVYSMFSRPHQHYSSNLTNSVLLKEEAHRISTPCTLEVAFLLVPGCNELHPVAVCDKLGCRLQGCCSKQSLSSTMPLTA